MPDIDWDDMIVPYNVPVKLTCYNDDTAYLECGICGESIAWTEDGQSSRVMAFGDIASSFTLHVSAEHGK